MSNTYFPVPLFAWPAAPGGKLHTYAAGGTTPATTWQDLAGSVPNTNPVTLDSTGTAKVMGSGTYHFVLNDATDTTTLWDADNYSILDSSQITYDQTAAELAAGVTPVNYAYPPPNWGAGDLLRYPGGTAPAIPNAVFFDASISQSLIGNAGLFATNLWLSNGTVGSRASEFANAFEYNASGGGTYNNAASAFGVALFAGAKLTAGSRAIWAANFVTEIDTARQNQAYGIEADVNNNSGADCGITSNEYDQIGAVLAASGGSYSPLFGFQCSATAQASRFQIGASITNWKSFGIQIVQDPVGVPAGASTAVTGPCLLMQASSNGGTQPIMRILNLAGALQLQILQNGQLQLPNNIGLDFLDSGGTPQTAVLVSSANNTYLACSPTGPGNGYLADSSLNVKFAFNATGLAFYGTTPIAKPTVTGAKGGNAALTSLMTTLANLGLVTDSTT